MQNKSFYLVGRWSEIDLTFADDRTAYLTTVGNDEHTGPAFKFPFGIPEVGAPVRINVTWDVCYQRGHGKHRPLVKRVLRVYPLTELKREARFQIVEKREKYKRAIPIDAAGFIVRDIDYIEVPLAPPLAPPLANWKQELAEDAIEYTQYVDPPRLTLFWQVRAPALPLGPLRNRRATWEELMNCPNCNHELPPQTIAAAAAEYGRMTTQLRRRTVAGPGRPAIIRRCERCGAEGPAREMRRHRCAGTAAGTPTSEPA